MSMKSNEDAIAAAQAAKDNLETMRARFAALRVRMEIVSRSKDRDALKTVDVHVRRSVSPQSRASVHDADQTASDIDAFRETRQRGVRLRTLSQDRS